MGIDLSILSKDGYFDRFFELCVDTKTYREAYEQVEEEYINLIGSHRYSSYESFKTIKTRYLRGLSGRKKVKGNNVYQCPQCKRILLYRVGE